MPKYDAETMALMERVAQNVKAGKKVEKIEIKYIEEGQEKTVALEHPYVVHMFVMCALEVYERAKTEQP